MKQHEHRFRYNALRYDELAEPDRRLVELARQATQRSYAPYSHFHVGAAAALENGETVCGSNQENAAFPSGTCAERTAIFYANAQYPNSAVLTLAIAARDRNGRFADAPISPCGACRQVLIETEFRQKRPLRMLLCGETEIYEIESARQLLPFAFDDTCM